MICFALHGRGGLVLLVLDTLENEDDDQHRKTRKVGDRAGDDHQQAAGDQRDAADPLHIPDQVAHQAGGDRRHTEGRGDDDGGNAQELDIAADKDQCVVVSKDVGNDERRDGKTGRVPGGLHRGRLGDGRACVGSQCNGRGDVCDDTEVEAEHVGSHQVETHAGGKDRRAGGGHDDVVRGGGHAHAEHDAAEHRQHESDDQVTVGQTDDRADEHLAETGHGDDAGDDTSHTAGNTDAQAVLAAVFKCVDDGGQALDVGLADGVVDNQQHEGDGKAERAALLAHEGARLEAAAHEGHEQKRDQGDRHDELLLALFTADHGDDHAVKGRVHGGGGHRKADHDHVDQNDQREDEVDLREQELPLGELFAGQALEAELLGLEVHAEEDAEEVQECGQDRTHDDLCIGNADHFRHQERRSAHDRGHDLTAGGRCSLDRAGKLRGITGLLHHRDGDGTGGHGVTDGGTGDHAAQSGGNDRDLCRAAARPTDQRVRAVDEEVCDTRGLQEGAEDDEQRDVGRADADRGAEDTGGGVEEVIHNGL